MDLRHINASDGNGPAAPASVTTARSPSASVIQVNATTNWPDRFIATYGVLDEETDTLDISTVRVFYGRVDGTTLVIDGFAPGFTDDGNSVGDKVYIKPVTAWADLIASTLAVSHNNDGSLNQTALDSAAVETLNTGREAEDLRVSPRVISTASTTTLTPNIDNANQYEVSALAAAMTIEAPAGTPNDGDILIFFIKDNGTSRALSWNAAFTNISGLSGLTATTAGKWHTVGARWSVAAGKWLIVSITTGA